MSDRRLPPPAPSLPVGEPCADHARPDAERSAFDLDAAELFVVGCFRAWVAPHLRPGRPAPDWRDMFRIAGVLSAGLAGFDAMMAVIGGAARRLIDVRCPACPAVSPDEEALLRLVAHLQAGEALGALDILDDWLAADAVQPALAAALRFAALTATAGLRVPSRGSATPRPVLH